MKRAALLFVGIFLAAFLIRFMGLGTFMTADEENWVIRSGEWWHALAEGNPGGTFITSHPGATLMWIAGSGVFLQEARLDIGVDTSTIVHFRKAALTMVVLAISFLLGCISVLLARLMGLWPAVLVSLLLVFDPYSVGMSQVVHLDMLLSLCMLASLIAFLCSLQTKFNHSSNIVFSSLAGLFAGAALATKMLPSLWLFASFGAVLAFQLFVYKKSFVSVLRHGLFIGGLAVLTFSLLWPALWVKPDVGDTLSRDTASVITDEHVAYEESEETISPMSFYPRTLAGRLLPLSLIGLLAGAVLVVVPGVSREQRIHIAWILFYSAGFLLLITFVAKKSDRYALPAISAILVLTGYVLSLGFSWLSARVTSYTGRAGVYAGAAVIALLIIIQPFLWSPYAIAYNNVVFPDVRFATQQGWGEGLDAAAAWLNERPGAEKTYVASWYPAVTATYFKGFTMHLSSRNDYRIAYIVTYRNMRGRAGDDEASNVLDEVKDKKPAHVVSINGVPYAWIYETLNVGNFTRHIGELTQAKTVGQLVKVEQPTVSAVEIGFATFSGRNNTEDVILHIRESLDSTQDLRVVRLNAADIVDNEWQRLEFEPIKGTAGKELYLFLESPTSVAGNAVTIRYIDADIRPGDMILNGQKKPGDIAYKILN